MGHRGVERETTAGYPSGAGQAPIHRRRGARNRTISRLGSPVRDHQPITTGDIIDLETSDSTNAGVGVWLKEQPGVPLQPGSQRQHA